MPLIKEVKVIPEPSPNALTPITPRPGQRPDGEFKNSVVDVRKRAVDTLLAHVDGSRWQITYYRQLLTTDMEPVSFQKLQDVPYQQYEKIHFYPLRVTDPLSTTQNAETQLFTVSGAGILAIALIPNIGDVFYGDIGDGRYGLFSIEKIVRKTILKDSVFEIDYSLIDYKTELNQKILDSRVVRSLYFSEDHVGSGRGPLISNRELQSYRNIKEVVNDLFEYHLDRFLDKENTTLLRPNIDRVYDPYFSIFWDKVLPKDIGNLMDIPRTIIVGDEYKNYLTIWDSILAKREMFDRIEVGFDLETSLSKEEILIYDGVSYTDIDKVVTIDDSFLIPSPLPMESEDVERPTLPSFHAINDSGYYIFSEYFYLRRYSKISKLELLVFNYLKRKPLNIEIFFDLLAEVKTLVALEQFYFIPTLIVLGIDHLRGRT